MNRIIFLTLVLVLAMVGCDLFEKDDTPTTTHPNPTAVIGFSPNSPTVTQIVTLDATGSKTSYGVICVTAHQTSPSSGHSRFQQVPQQH